MKKKHRILLEMLIVLVLLTFSSATSQLGSHLHFAAAGQAISGIINVPIDYPTIQTAVNAANPGDTIQVGPGIYMENIVIETDSIKLIGSSPNNTIVDGNAAISVFNVKAVNVTINGFTIRNAFYGVFLIQVSSCLIENNVLTGNHFGIYLAKSSDCVIKANMAIDNEHNIHFALSTNNTLTRNVMQGTSSYSLGVDGSTVDHYIQNVDTSNTVNGKPVYWIANAQNVFVNPQTYPNAGSLIIANSTGVQVLNINISNNFDGILFAFDKNCTVDNSTVTNNKNGLDFFKSQDCAANQNTIMNNNFEGILLTSSSNCSFYLNNITMNVVGIKMESTNNIIFECNTISKSLPTGVEISNSDYASFYHNNFVDNTAQIDILNNSTNNKFDNGLEGNFWSNYNGTDNNSDGIGDTGLPFQGIDNFPLMGQYSELIVGAGTSRFTLVALSNSTMNNILFNPTKRDLNITFASSNLGGFCRISLPSSVLPGSLVVLIDGSIPRSIKQAQEDTNTVLYFTYFAGSTQAHIFQKSSITIQAVAGQNQNVKVNEIVSFNGSASISSLGITRYQWLFGDGMNSTQPSPWHFYTQSGNYTVTLIIWDILSNKATTSIEVLVVGATSPIPTSGTNPGSSNPHVGTGILTVPVWAIALGLAINAVASISIAIIVFRGKKSSGDDST